MFRRLIGQPINVKFYLLYMEELMQQELIQKVAEKIYSLFVINYQAAGIQQPNGIYITKYFPLSPFVLEQMLKYKGSMGCYQQGFRTNYIKWICFDFDCVDKDTPDLNMLYEKAVAPVCKVLDNFNINFLTEFSGRRGIHVWVIFDTIIPKSTGYHILQKILEYSNFGEQMDGWNLDKFPATDTSKNNIVGKQIKFPLSCHQLGGRSYFFTGVFHRPEFNSEADFFINQNEILNNYVENQELLIIDSLGIKDTYSYNSYIKFKKYRVSEKINVSLESIMDILSKTKVYDQLFRRMRRGQAKPEDWTVLLGTLGGLDQDASILKDLLSQFPNYDINKTLQNIDRLRNRYYPATFRYLYEIYGIDMEEGINPDETGLMYLAKKLGIEHEITETIVNRTVYKEIRGISNIVEKEKNYLLDNDEVPNIPIWLQLNSLLLLDKHRLDKSAMMIQEGKDDEEIVPQAVIYYRQESEEKQRILVSLGATDRVLTTYIAVLLYDKLKQAKWDSYSYHVSLLSSSDIFYPWFSSWSRYISRIRTFLDVPFLGEYNVFYIDLKGFYDHIDFLTVYREFKKELDTHSENIIRWLIRYNDHLMKKINKGNRIGVPQGPAYARIIAELFLSRVLRHGFGEEERSHCHVYRYVDDIVVFCEPGLDARSIYRKLQEKLMMYGLPINRVKSEYMGNVANLTQEQKKDLLHTDKMSYELSDMDDGYVLLPFERSNKLEEYLMKHDFDISVVSYIFGKKTIGEAQQWCIDKHAEDIFSSIVGRGSSFRRFYDFLWLHENICEQCLVLGYFNMIPRQSINFKNCLATLYIAVQNREISQALFEQIKKMFLKKIDASELDREEMNIKYALINYEMGEQDDDI